MNLDHSCAIVVLVLLTILVLLLPILGVWLYWRGRMGANPLPRIIASVVDREPAAPPQPDPPSPSFPCPKCMSTVKPWWKLSEDKTRWQCAAKGCGHAIVIPKR